MAATMANTGYEADYAGLNYIFLQDATIGEPAFIDYPTTGIDFDEYLSSSIYEDPEPQPTNLPQRQHNALPQLDTQGTVFPEENLQVSPLSDFPYVNLVPSLSPSSGDTAALSVSVENTFERSNSKRRREACNNEPEKQKRARYPRVAAGYPCPVLNCGQTFDTNGDLQKHQKRAHSTISARPCKCELPACEARFFWPKDVRRHMEQVHLIKRAGKPTTTVAIVHTRPGITSQPQSSTVKTTNIMKSLAHSVLMLKRLRIRSGSKSSDDHESGNEKIIMVTRDKHSFVDVDVTGISSAGSMINRITKTLNAMDTQSIKLYTYDRVRGVGKQLSNEALVALITRKADAQGSLRLYLQAPSAMHQ